MKALTIILSMCLASFASIYLLSIFGVPVNPCPEAKTLHNLTDLAPGESLTISMPAVDTTYRVRTIVPGPGVIVVNRQYGDSTNTRVTYITHDKPVSVDPWYSNPFLFITIIIAVAAITYGLLLLWEQRRKVKPELDYPRIVEGETWPGVKVRCWEVVSYDMNNLDDGGHPWMVFTVTSDQYENIHHKIELKRKSE